MGTKITLEYFIDKLGSGKPVFMYYDLEDVALKFTPKSRMVVINTGTKKYEVDSSTTIATDGRLDCVEITEKQFDEFQSKK